MSESWPPQPEGWPEGKSWPPVQSLDDAFDKLRWAETHLETLRVEIEPFEQRDTHRFTFECDSQMGMYFFNVHGLEPVGLNDWGLIIGDCLHNARTALDYLMVRLVALTTGDEPRLIERVQFPIYDDPDRFRSSVAQHRKESGFSGYLTRIEELQPFNVANPSIWGAKPLTGDGMDRLFPTPIVHALPKALNRLALLDNLDKHRVIHAAWLGVKPPEIAFIRDQPNFPTHFTYKGGMTYTGALEDGTQVGYWEFEAPLPHAWDPDEMDVKRQFPLAVSIADERQFTGRVLDVLPFCLWGVRSVLELFSPVFERSEPPLPVTTVPKIPDYSP